MWPQFYIFVSYLKVHLEALTSSRLEMYDNKLPLIYIDCVLGMFGPKNLDNRMFDLCCLVLNDSGAPYENYNLQCETLESTCKYGVLGNPQCFDETW